MPSSIFLLFISFSLLTVDLCSAASSGQTPNVPTGPTPPSGPLPPGVHCTFRPISGFGPDTTSPGYNAKLVSLDSISNYIQCTSRNSYLASNDDDKRIVNALDILVSATTTKKCAPYKLSKVIQNYAYKTNRSEKLIDYLCGRARNKDLCDLSRCIGAKDPEQNLEGECTNGDVSLFLDPGSCRVIGDDLGGDDSTTTTDDIIDDDTNVASSPTTVIDASDSTATALISSSSDTTTPTSQAQTTGITADAGSTSISNAASSMLTAAFGTLTTAGILLIVLAVVL